MKELSKKTKNKTTKKLLEAAPKKLHREPTKKKILKKEPIELAKKSDADEGDKNLTFDVSDLIRADVGQSREFHLEVSEDFDPKDFVLTSDIATDVIFMKTENGISVQLEDFTYTVNMTCCRCLKVFGQEVVIPLAQREFLFLRPKDIADVEDVYTTDLKRMEVDLRNMFRQEILLHFDAFPVCSPSCRGICPVCGKDQNKAKCGHELVEQVDNPHNQEESVKPFQGLKNIIQRKK
ncbi:MAG: DUF177 domain-containing protein [Candidatus Peregrinibacteria bacterium]|nr:DUF177 domain-containing protein [Candidatus Peregrinibacteria bacterium]